MSTPPPDADQPFAIESFQNPYLGPGSERVDAILSVTAAGTAGGSSRPLLLGFVIDTSGSMQGPRIEAVRQAAATAIGLLEEWAGFFVVTFNNSARVVVPPSRAGEEARAGALRALQTLAAAGGTAMSQGLAAARSLFASSPEAIGQCIFLTDGKNESELAREVTLELERCAGLFSCDCWGVGTDWKVGEVQEIARALLGKASLIPEAAGIEAAFREAVAKAQSKSMKGVRLRVWTPAGTEVISCKQVSPTIEDYTGRSRVVDAQVREYDTGAWGAGEARDYQLALRVKPGNVGDRMLAARPSLVFVGPDGGEVEVRSPGARVFANWTADDALSSRLDATVAHYNGQDELAAAIQKGLEAREQGDEGTATDLLGRAVKIAHESGNADMTTRLKKVVDVLDPAQGTVLLKKTVSKVATMDLELESTTTRRARRPGGEGG
ncbi:MAG: VWA domain-containing protein [Actinobacteria bacterium]|nr:VWA domain-containing protein [Actinomycetota bacterium]